jgi:hypothetical protein
MIFSRKNAKRRRILPRRARRARRKIERGGKKRGRDKRGFGQDEQDGQDKKRRSGVTS